MRGRVSKGILFASVALLTATAAQAGWEEHATPYDVDRMKRLSESRAAGLSEADTGNPRDVAAIHGVLDRGAQPASLSELSGHWRCRSMKLGGMERTKVYAWFSCHIGERDGRAFFAKDSGSQHFGGALYDNGGSYVLLAGMNVAHTPTAMYSGGRDYIGADITPSDAVGLLSSTGPRSARIEFPWPAQESVFDVIELRR
jgi:hypothetical protein